MGSYTATWSPAAPWPNVTVDTVVGGENSHAVWLWEGDPRPGNCDFSDCWAVGGNVSGACLVGVGADDLELCVTDDGLGGTIRPMTSDYTVALARR